MPYRYPKIDFANSRFSPELFLDLKEREEGLISLCCIYPSNKLIASKMSGVNLLTSGLKKPPQKQRLSTPFPLSPSKDLNDNNNNNHNIINNNKNSNNNNNNNNNNEKEISNKKIISTFALNLSLAKPQVGVFVPPDIPPPLVPSHYFKIIIINNLEIISLR